MPRSELIARDSLEAGAAFVRRSHVNAEYLAAKRARLAAQARRETRAYLFMLCAGVAIIAASVSALGLF